MSLKELFPDYTVEIGEKYLPHLEIMVKFWQEIPFYQLITSKEIIDFIHANNLKLPKKAPLSIITKLTKIIRKSEMIPFFIVANNLGYTKIDDKEEGISWRQSMVERIASMQSQIDAFDKKFKGLQDFNEELTLKIDFQ